MQIHTHKTIDFLKNFYPKNGAKYCAKNLNISISSVRNLVFKYKIVKEKFNKDQFLNIQTPEMAYVLGLIWADGSLDKNRITITCLQSDMKYLYKVFLSLGKCKIREKQPAQRNKKRVSIVRFFSKEFYDFLLEHDYSCKSNASACKILSKIPDNLKHYWFRGLSDGDGCFSKSWECHSSYAQDWFYLKKICETLQISFFIYERKRICKNNNKVHSGSCFRLSRRLFNTIKFGNYIYNNYYQDKIGFPRKYNKFLQIISQNQKPV